MDLLAAVNKPAGREIRPGHELDQLVDRDIRILDKRDRGIDDLGQVVRRDLRRHSDGDAFRTVDQQQRNTRRHDLRLRERFVVVRLEIDGLLFDVGEDLVGQLLQADLGVTHRRRRCRRRSSRNFPARRSAGNASKIPARAGRSYRRAAVSPCG